MVAQMPAVDGGGGNPDHGCCQVLNLPVRSVGADQQVVLRLQLGLRYMKGLQAFGSDRDQRPQIRRLSLQSRLRTVLPEDPLQVDSPAPGSLAYHVDGKTSRLAIVTAHLKWRRHRPADSVDAVAPRRLS